MRLQITKPKLRKKSIILLSVIFVTLVLITTYLLLLPARRQKTFLLHNNERLCISNRPTSHNQNSIVIVVLSCRQNVLQRNLIRQTYGSIRHLNNVQILAVVFMMGTQDPENEARTDISQLEAEMLQFDDLIVGDFVDTYENLTRKSIMAYEWLVSFCQEADLVVKTDDDVMLDIFKLTAELSTWTPTVFRSFYFWCAVHWGEIFDRNETSRYYVSPEEHLDDKVPEHCAGVGYVTTMSVVKRISDEISSSFLTVVCPQEDVFMTGIVPEHINLATNEHIGFIEKNTEWIFYIFVYENVDENVAYLLKLLQQPFNETVDFDEFRKRFKTQFFYLIDHGPKFEKLYRRIWHLVESSHHNELEIKSNMT